MKKFFYGTFIFFCAILMVFVYLIVIPIIGDWIRHSSVDGRLIALCVIAFCWIAGYYFHIAQKRADEDWLNGKYDNEIK